ncbi:MarR family transcriptional regulator [Romboutsia weinsteinii]|uniref:MarR family transcriptional regulator n=1 Tax=Romboutsia weinsteinii TaxID=2020949 RepID=A0A371J3F5_9FIRM|nr:MarR family transcriptional regulator [Romboutsia weinsteinii]RDY27214.1 MarR family transcriptional regulator [Romboutsia weinsteinii]
MNDAKLEIIIQNFITIMPLFQKKLMKPKCHVNPDNLNHSHMQILVVLKDYGKSSISDVAKKLFISTPNMTKLLNKLIDDGYVERLPDQKDRRIINIDLTTKGKEHLDNAFEDLVRTFKERLSSIPDNQLDKLNNSLENLKEVLTEISSED